MVKQMRKTVTKRKTGRVNKAVRRVLTERKREVLKKTGGKQTATTKAMSVAARRKLQPLRKQLDKGYKCPKCQQHLKLVDVLTYLEIHCCPSCDLVVYLYPLIYTGVTAKNKEEKDDT